MSQADFPGLTQEAHSVMPKAQSTKCTIPCQHWQTSHTLLCSQLIGAVVFHGQPLNDIIEHLNVLVELAHVNLGGLLDPTEYVESLQLHRVECKPCLQVHLYAIKKRTWIFLQLPCASFHKCLCEEH